MDPKDTLHKPTLLPLPEMAAVETRAVWRALADAHRHLAELKGLSKSLPRRALLIETLEIQEAKDSSEIENIITTHDELYASAGHGTGTQAAKEVRHYVVARLTPIVLSTTAFIIRFRVGEPCFTPLPA